MDRIIRDVTPMGYLYGKIPVKQPSISIKQHIQVAVR
jgi:hypothetical protein